MVYSLQRLALQSRGADHRSAGEVGKVGRKTKYRMGNYNHTSIIAIVGVKNTWLSILIVQCNELQQSYLFVSVVSHGDSERLMTCTGSAIRLLPMVF